MFLIIRSLHLLLENEIIYQKKLLMLIPWELLEVGSKNIRISINVMINY